MNEPPVPKAANGKKNKRKINKGNIIKQ